MISDFFGDAAQLVFLRLPDAQPPSQIQGTTNTTVLLGCVPSRATFKWQIGCRILHSG